MPFEVYRSRDLLVRAVQDYRSATCVVTFDSYSDEKTLDRLGFGESLFSQYSIDAIHFISRHNNWYQDRELLGVWRIVRELTHPYDRVLTYGSSMGGYAAIRFARNVGAQFAISISPQFSINPAIVPFDKRWINDAADIDFHNERTSGTDFSPLSYVFYDPYNLDARHVELYRPYTQLVEIKLPNSGHPSSGFLAEVGVLQEAVLELCSGEIDPQKVLRKARLARGSSAQFYFALAERSNSVRRKVRLAERASKLSPNNANYLGYYAYALGRNGQLEAAKAIFKSAKVNYPYANPILFWESELYVTQGNFGKAIEITEEAIARYNGGRSFLTRRAHLMKHMQNLKLQSHKRVSILNRFVRLLGYLRLN